MAEDTPTTETETDELPAPPPVPAFEVGAAPRSKKPPYMVVGSTFVAQSEQGEIKLPMSFKTKLFRLMPDDLELIGQLWYLLEGSEGQQKVLERIDEIDIEHFRDLARKFFQAYTERQAVRRLGESRSSSIS